MRGRPPLEAEIAKSSTHKVFLTKSEKSIAKLMPELIGKSGSDYIRESFLLKLKDLIDSNPKLRTHVEKEIKREGLEMPMFLR